MTKKETKNDKTKIANENITRLLAKGTRLPEGERKSVDELEELTNLIVAGSIMGEHLTEAQRRLVLDSRSDSSDTPSELKRHMAKELVAFAGKDADSDARLGSAMGTARIATLREAGFSEKRAEKRIENTIKASRPRVRDDLAELIYRTIAKLGLEKAKPSIVIGQLGKHDTNNILRAYREYDEYQRRLDPKVVTHYFNDDHIHWIDNENFVRISRKQFGDRVLNARKKLARKPA